MTRTRTPPRRKSRLRTAEAWWPLIARILSFLLGAGIIVHQTVIDTSDRLGLLLVGAGLMGLLPLSMLASAVGSREGGGQ